MEELRQRCREVLALLRALGTRGKDVGGDQLPRGICFQFDQCWDSRMLRNWRLAPMWPFALAASSKSVFLCSSVPPFSGFCHLLESLDLFDRIHTRM